MEKMAYLPHRATEGIKLDIAQAHGIVPGTASITEGKLRPLEGQGLIGGHVASLWGSQGCST